MAKQLKDNLLKKDIDVEYYNVGTAEGLAEATFYNVMALPTIIVEDDYENVVSEWRGVVPKLEEINLGYKNV